MKKVFLVFLLFSVTLFMSCGDDDSGTIVDVNGTVQIGENSVSITNGLFGENTQDGAYGATFIISDGPVRYNTTEDEISFQGENLISLVIASTGDSFQPGTYPLEFTSTKGALVITANSSNQGLIGTGGSVEVSGSGNVFTITFNVDLNDETKLTGSVSGAFEIIELDFDEEEEEEEVENGIIFDGTTYVGTDGLLVDVGVEADIAPNHYTRKFAISDKVLSYNSSSGNFSVRTDASFALVFGASSLGTDEFKTGEFQFRPSAGSVPDDNFFFSAMFKANGTWTSVNGGTMKISGTSPDYTVELDITLNGGEEVTGAFVGTFDVE